MLNIVCRNCVLNRKRASYAKDKEEQNPEKLALIKDAQIRCLYGIGLNEFNLAMIAQDSKCAICHQDGLKLYIDHSHVDKNVRALLCHFCNSGFGRLAENIEYMENAIQYLNKHGNT